MNPTQTSNQEATRLQPLRQKPGVIVSVALLIVIGIGLGRIVSTYHVFNHTIDEGAHLACGIQWFQGSYTYDRKHTPIARISIAVLPYLNGLRGFGNESFWEEGSLILSSGGRYWHNLILARVGVLPYFVLAVVVVFLWTRRLYGDATGLIAAAIFSMLPVVLAHSGLATTDIPLTACYIIAVYAFTRWLEEPNRRTTVLFGIATGVALATKLSTLAFLPATILGILPLYFLTTRVTAAGGDEKRWGLGSVRSVARAIAIVIVCAFLVIWTTYKFSHAPITVISGEPDKIAAKVFGRSSSMGKGIRVLDAKLQLPAPELIEGVRELRDINNTHPRSYLFGRIRSGGWWYFYPVAIAVKTPLAALLRRRGRVAQHLLEVFDFGDRAIALGAIALHVEVRAVNRNICVVPGSGLGPGAPDLVRPARNRRQCNPGSQDFRDLYARGRRQMRSRQPGHQIVSLRPPGKQG